MEYTPNESPVVATLYRVLLDEKRCLQTEKPYAKSSTLRHPLLPEPLERVVERHRFSAHQPFELFGSKTAVKRARRLLFQTLGWHWNNKVGRAAIEPHERPGKF